VSTDSHSWSSTETVTALTTGVALLLAAVVIEARFAAHPLVPLSVFRRRPLCAANGIAMIVGAALFGRYFFVSLYLQQVAGYSPLRTGLAILPAGAITLAGSLIAARLVARIGARRQLLLGPVLAAAGLLWMSFLSFGDGYWTHMFVPLVLFGLGIGTTFTPMTLTATAGIPPAEAGLASGLVNTSRQVGGAVGLAAHRARGAGRRSRGRGRRAGPGRHLGMKRPARPAGCGPRRRGGRGNGPLGGPQAGYAAWWAPAVPAVPLSHGMWKWLVNRFGWRWR
jgi:Major Facilitator Superfamily